MSEPLAPCPDCGALVLDIDGPTHRYLGASPGCWQAYGRLLLGETNNDPDAHIAPHRLAVDTYAAQHPGTNGPQARHSVDAHLVVICLVLERNLDISSATSAIRRFLDKHKHNLPWLDPPPNLGSITVLDILGATDQQDHNRLVLRWATSVWQAWSAHHSTIRAWADTVWD